MGIWANYRQISEFEYFTFKRSPLKAYQVMFGNQTNVWSAFNEFARKTEAAESKIKPIHDEYGAKGLYDRLQAVDFDHTRLTGDDRRLFDEQKLKIDAVLRESELAPPDNFTIEKAWEAIHYLLTGQTEGGDPPLSWAVLGGLKLPDTANYTDGSPLRMLSPEQVEQVARALERILPDDLLSRATLQEMVSRSIYLISEDPREADYIRHHYENLRRYYSEAADHGNAMLLSLG